MGLIALCEATGDKRRLEEYMETFRDQGFSEFVFAWHVREGKQAKLLKETPMGRKGELGAFLKQGHSKLAWLHSLEGGDYMAAADTLKGLAEGESDPLPRKKVPR